MRIPLSLSLTQLTFASPLEFKDFKDWNADEKVAAAAQELYGDIDKLELYPGLHAEGCNGDGSGVEYDRLRVHTMRNGLLLDAVALVRRFCSRSIYSWKKMAKLILSI